MYDRMWYAVKGSGQALACSNASVRSTALDVGHLYTLWGTTDFAFAIGGSTVTASTTGDPAWPERVDLPCFQARADKNYVAVKSLSATGRKVYIFKVRTLD